MVTFMQNVTHWRSTFFSHLVTFIGWFWFAIVAWVFGALHLSFAWIVLILVIGAFLQSGHLLQARKRKIHRQVNGEDDVAQVWPHMPSWIYFTEKEHALWVNRILDQMWPYVEDMVQTILKQSVEPAIQQCLPTPLQSFCFEKIALGQTPPYITNIQTYHASTKHREDEFIMDLDVVYNGDAQFTLGISKVKLGVSDFQLHGPLRVILKPLMPDYNPVGGVTVFFLNRPKISFDLTNLLSFLDIPGLKDILMDIVDDVVASFVVLPNRIAVPLSIAVDGADLQYPIPDGVLRVEMIEAKELIKADFALFGRGSSDPYSIIQIGAQKFRTKTKNNNCDPVWKETFEAFIDNTEGQELFVKIYDEDVVSKNTEIGQVDVQVALAFANGTSDLWLPLEGVKEGRVHMNLTWFSLSSNPKDIRQATPGNPSVAALFVKVISAVNLPGNLSSVEDPSMLLCKVSVGKTSFDTYQVSGATPTWNQGMRFLVSNQRTQSVRINVMEANDEKVLGYVSFDIRRLENVPGMTHEEAFHLVGPGFEQTSLKCKIVLRAMKAPPIKSKPAGSKTPLTDGDVTEVDSSDYRRGDVSTASLCTSAWGMSSQNSIEPSTEELPTRGEVKLTLKYDHAKNRLLINMIRADGLCSRDNASKTNPYVRMYLLPDRTKKSRRKTGAVRGSLSPVFNETLEYVIGLDQLKDRDLDVAVKNARPGLHVRRGWNLIGRTTIQLSDLNLSSGITMTCELKK